jgi:hypothetical protein
MASGVTGGQRQGAPSGLSQPVPAAPTPTASASTPAAALPAPFTLTAAHFWAALLFFVLGAAGLVWVAPELAAGRYLLPRVVVVTHLFTLGWITTSIMGALYPLFPVVLGTRMGWYGLGYVSLTLYVPGLLLFTGGLLSGATALMLAGAALFSTGLLLFLVNAAVGMAGAPTRDATWRTLAAAFVFLLVTIVLGASLAGNLRWFYLADRLLALGVHMHVALGGWVLLMVIGVGRKLLPMFLLSHHCEQRPGAMAAVLVGAGAAVLTVFHHVPGPAVTWAAAGLLATGVAAFLVQVALFLRHGHRPGLDPGLRLAAAGMGFLGVSVVLGVAAFLLGFGNTAVNTAYGAAAVVGAFSLFVAGHYYKIVPFLVWNHRFAPLVGQGRALPRVAELYSTRVATVAAALLITGAAGLVACIAAEWAMAARAAAAVFAAGAILVTLQMLSLFRRSAES